MTKKFLSALLAVLMVVSMVPMAAMAEGDTAPLAVRAPLGDTHSTYTSEQLNIDGYTVTATPATETLTESEDVTVYDVELTHPALLKHYNAASPAAEGLWIGIGVPVTVLGDGNGQGEDASSYYSILATDQTAFSTIETKFKETGYQSQGKPGYGAHGYRSSTMVSDKKYVTQYYDLANTKNFPDGKTDGKVIYFIERNPETKEGTTTYTYKVYRINKINVTEGYIVKYSTPANGTLSVKIGDNAVTSDTAVAKGSKLTITATPAQGYKVTSVKNGDTVLTAVNGAYEVTVDAAVNITATFEEDLGAELIPAIVEAMGNYSPVDGAPLHDTRTEEQGGIPDEELYTAETYTVTVTSSDLQPYDLDVNVAAKGLKGHQNADSPASMGYWVGVRFPVVDGWTITKYQRDNHAEATITEDNLTTDADGNKKTLNAYYNVGDASEDVENPRQRPVTVTYKKADSEKTVDVKFLVKLAGVEIVVPAAKPEEDGRLSEQTKKDITSAITAAATGSSENHEDTEVANIPTVSVETAADGSITIDKAIVGALKDAATNAEKNNVDLKIVGQGGAEATIPASTAKELDTANDLVPTVKAEDATTKAEETANKVTDEAKKAIVTQALETLTTEVANAENKNYIVTVSMVQNGTEKFTTAGDCEITVKVPVPSSQYTVLVHIGKDGAVTTQAATPKSEVKDGKTSWYLSVKLTHLSTMFGAKPADVADIPAETPIAPDVTFVEPTDSTPDKNWYFPYSGELTITNNTGRERTYLIGLAKTAYGDNQAVFVQTIANGASWKVRCHKDMKLYLLELTSSVDLSSDDLPEDVIHRWKTVTEFVTQ